MNKDQFSKRLTEQHNRGKALLSLISGMHESQNDFGDGMVMFGGEDLYYVPDDELDEFRNKFEAWKSYVGELLVTQFGPDDQYVYDWNNYVITYVSKRRPILNQLKKNVNKGLSLIESFQQRLELHFRDDGPVEEALKEETMAKPPKVFISHKKEDEAYAQALVNLINFIVGADGDKVFCSSVPGYGIRQSGDIMDEMKAQFDNYDVFMAIIHSPRYYQSAICLNEMGASWVLGTKFASFMTKDCEYKHMCGVINKEKICINPKDTAAMLNAHLNDFKNDLLNHFGLGALGENKWENARQQFVDAVTTLNYPAIAQSTQETNMFETWYIPAFEHIFQLLDIDHYQDWTYPCAIAGNTILSGTIYDKLDDVINYIKSRPKHKEYSSWDSLLYNLGTLVSDFVKVYSQHAEKLEDGRYIVERFYKRMPNNPNYEEDLEAYDEHVMLVSDMLFELTRLLNFILYRIRGLYPDYKQELGILHIDTLIDAPDLEYRENEISDAPYPGLKEYIKVRLTRETHLGSKANIDESGYERAVSK